MTTKTNKMSQTTREIAMQARALQEDGLTWKQVSRKMNGLGVRNSWGGRIRPQSIQAVVSRLNRLEKRADDVEPMGPVTGETTVDFHVTDAASYMMAGNRYDKALKSWSQAYMTPVPVPTPAGCTLGADDILAATNLSDYRKVRLLTAFFESEAA